MWSYRHRSGRTVTWQDLTLAAHERLVDQLDEPFGRVAPWASAEHARACAIEAHRVLGVTEDVDDVTLGQFTSLLQFDEIGQPELADDVPDEWIDGVPASGTGRVADRWIAQLCVPPFSFTPRQVRDEFTVRDLELIVAASLSRGDPA